MIKNITHRVGIDVAMFVTMLVSMVGGVVLWLFIPSGRGSGYTTFLSVAKHLWTDIHIYVSLIFCGVLLLRLALNLRLLAAWSSTCSTGAREHQKRLKPSVNLFPHVQ